MIRRWAHGVVVASFVLGAAGCSALLDWSNFSGGTGDGGSIDGSATEGSSSEGGSDAAVESTPGTCNAGSQCTTAAPSGWTGPVALYVGPTSQGAAPPCGSGFAATSVFDGNADLTAPPGTCSACLCGASTGVTCNGPVMSFFLDSSCGAGLGTQTVTSSCSPTPLGAMSVTVAAPAASGGSCATSGGVATNPPPVWGRIARACAPTSTSPGGCPTGQVCTPAPASPFSVSACVMQAGVASTCPPAYPSAPQVFYTVVDDQRGCSPCQCDPPAGAVCTITSPAVTNCIGGSLNAPNGCVAFTGPEPVKLASAPTVADAGSCVLAGGGAPTGAAAGKGATSFCCLP